MCTVSDVPMPTSRRTDAFSASTTVFKGYLTYRSNFALYDDLNLLKNYIGAGPTLLSDEANNSFIDFSFADIPGLSEKQPVVCVATSL